MKRLLFLGIALAVAMLQGCGGNSIADKPNNQGAGGAAAAAIVDLLLSNTQLSTAPNADPVTVTAQVKDATNAVVANVPVTFQASSGSITVTQSMTDADGIATAEVRNGGNPDNRVITVTAQSGTAMGTTDITVGTTTLNFTSGPGSLAQGDSANYVVTLLDNSNNGIAGRTLALTSALGNGINAASLVTDGTGSVSFGYTATNPGADQITASVASLPGVVDAVKTVDISDDAFTLEIAGMLTEIPLNTPTDVTVTWIAGGVPVAGSTVDFATTRGVLTPTSVVTDGAGQGTVSIQASSAGPALISATGQPGGPTTSISTEFVATMPANLEVQASPLTVATGDQSTLTATVTDANSNPVKNQTVNFAILTDPTGGNLSSATAVTGSQGRATVVYTAGNTPSAQGGVQIQAIVQGTAITVTENLTVARKELFISLGTGNDLFEPNTAQFRKEWVVQITDADGNAVSGVNVQVSINSLTWYQGCYALGQDTWVRNWTAACDDEDTNRNGVLDVPPTVAVAEDTNMNGRIEAGNIALVAAQGGVPGQAANVTTDATGTALVDVLYPQNYANWLEVEIEAKATVAGTESRRTTRFVLDAKAEDISNTSASPPGQFSPFGQNTWDGGGVIDLTQRGCLTAPETPDPVPSLCDP